jgi:nucleotide-binding universal stress UspA family protein
VIGEHVLVGYKGDAGGREALAQARTIVEVTGGRLTVGAVHGPEPAGSALEAQASLTQAEAALGDLPADYATQESRGSGRGLAVLASKVDADLIVIGSPGGGAHHRPVMCRWTARGGSPWRTCAARSATRRSRVRRPPPYGWTCRSG